MPDQTSVKKILVVTLSNLGDAVLTLPVFLHLHKAYPEARLHVVTGGSGAVVFERDSRIEKRMLYDRRISLKQKSEFLKNIRCEKYDLIVDLRYSFIGLLGGARRRNRYFSWSPRPTHRALRHLSALQGIVKKEYLTEHERESWLDRCVSDKALGAGYGAEKPFIAAAVGSKSDLKKWPAKNFARLLDHLAEKYACPIVLIGDKADEEDVKNVLSQMKRKAVDVCGRTRFSDLVDILRKARLLVTNDSAPLHIADALHTPVLALFGPTDPAKYGARTPGSVALTRQLFCSPCEKAQCRFAHECLDGLSVEEVYAKAQEIMEDRVRTENVRILVVRLDRVGDLVLSIPAIDALRQHFPDGKISVMTRPYTQDLLKDHPWVDEVIPYDYSKGGRHAFGIGYLRLMQEIRKRKFDVAFILHPGIRSYLIPFLAGVTYRIGYKNKWAFLLTRSLKDKRHLGLKHESDYALEIVEAFGVRRPTHKPGRTLFPDPLFAETIAGPLIAIHAGASCVSKRWPKENFKGLIQRILDDDLHRVVVIGGPEEKELCADLASGFGTRVVDRAGSQTLSDLAAMLRQCQVLVSNDSGPVHMASAVGTPVVSIFGRNQEGLSATRWRPLGGSYRVIQKDVGCVVCLAHNCPIEFECLKAITVDEVYEKMNELLLSHPTEATAR